MKWLNCFLNYLLLLIFPITTLCPRMGFSTLPTTPSIEIQDQGQLLSYDEIIDLIDQLEDGELEKTYTPKELEQINHFFATLARNGLSSNDTTEEFLLEADIEELLNEDDSYEYSYSSNRSTDYLFAPAIFYDQNNVTLCGGWLSKKWKQTKKFVKKHKKAILIGAAVVVAVAVKNRSDLFNGSSRALYPSSKSKRQKK